MPRTPISTQPYSPLLRSCHTAEVVQGQDPRILFGFLMDRIFRRTRGSRSLTFSRPPIYHGRAAVQTYWQSCHSGHCAYHSRRLRLLVGLLLGIVRPERPPLKQTKRGAAWRQNQTAATNRIRRFVVRSAAVQASGFIFSHFGRMAALRLSHSASAQSMSAKRFTSLTAGWVPPTGLWRGELLSWPGVRPINKDAR
jgi:hypothetical protein